MMEISRVEKDLISEIKLDPLQAKVFLLVTCYGKMSPSTIGEKLNISTYDALNTAKALMTLALS